MGIDRLDPALRHDQALVEHARTVAAEVLSRLGSDFEEAEPTGGWVNPGWTLDRYVIRVSLLPDDSSLQREAALAGALPPEVGYPEILDVGVLAGHEYVVTRRLPGANLAEVWPRLEPAERADALIQLWRLAVLVHRTSLGDLRSLDLRSSPFYADSFAEAAGALEAIQEQGALTTSEGANLLAHTERFFNAIDDAPHVLNHGDLHIGNALWDGNEIVSLLDFEFAVVAPMELDLNELAKHAFGPPGVNPDPWTKPEQKAVIDVVADLHINTALLLGYSILLESWFTKRSLRGLTPEQVRATDSCQRLVALADPQGGHLADLLQG